MKLAGTLFILAVLAGCGGSEKVPAYNYSVDLCADCAWATPGSVIDGLPQPYPVARCELVGSLGMSWALASCQGNPTCTLPSCSPSAPCCHATGPQAGCTVPVSCDRPL